MLHSQNFGKTDSFLKSVLNIFILSNLIVGLVEGAIKEGKGVVFSIKPMDSGEVLIVGSRIHQSKTWYYSFQTSNIEPSRVEVFVEIVYGYKSLTFFVKSTNLDV